MQDQKHITYQQYCDLVTLASMSKCDTPETKQLLDKLCEGILDKA